MSGTSSPPSPPPTTASTASSAFASIRAGGDTRSARLGWERKPDGIYLDLCAGTLDFAATLARQPGFRGSGRRRRLRRRRCSGSGRRQGRRAWRRSTADALELPFPDAAFDGAMVGWGVRNLVDLDAGLAEAARVLRPGGRLVILEMALPPPAAAAPAVHSSISGACCRGSADGSRNIRPPIPGYQRRRSRFPSRPSSRGGSTAQGFRRGGLRAVHGRRVRAARGDAGRGAVRTAGARASSASVRSGDAERASVARRDDSGSTDGPRP